MSDHIDELNEDEEPKHDKTRAEGEPQSTRREVLGGLAAGLAAVGLSGAAAASPIKSRILARIKSDIEADANVETSAYIKGGSYTKVGQYFKDPPAYQKGVKYSKDLPEYKKATYVKDPPLYTKGTEYNKDLPGYKKGFKYEKNVIYKKASPGEYLKDIQPVDEKPIGG